jgi:hypothetical protein
VSEFESLKKWATPRQQSYLDAVEKQGSCRAAARALGVHHSGIVRAIASLKYQAAVSGHSPEHDMTHTVPDGYQVKGVSTYYNAEGKPTGQWVKSSLDYERQAELFKAWVETLSDDVRGKAQPVDAPKHCDADLLAVFPIGDPHFGLRSWWQDAGGDFDLGIAESLTFSAVDRLVDSAPAAKTAVLLNLGDMFHADNQSNQSKSGHQLDVDGRWSKVLQVGLRTMIHCIKRMLEKHETVVVRINRGNHDGHSSYALSLMLSCYFDREARVDVDISPQPFWYFQFGKVLIGSMHGDTVKGKDMLSIMAADEPEAWGRTKHRYCYLGHVHHHDSKEYAGGIVEYFRTLATRDAWHTAQGYRAGRDMCLIVHHKEFGEIERHRVDVGSLTGA